MHKYMANKGPNGRPAWCGGQDFFPSLSGLGHLRARWPQRLTCGLRQERSWHKWLEKAVLESVCLLNVAVIALFVRGMCGLHFCSARSDQIRGFASLSSSELCGCREVKGNFAVALGAGSAPVPPLCNLCQLYPVSCLLPVF